MNIDSQGHPSLSNPNLPLLIVVEGNNDVEFLRRISAMLSATDAAVPNLSILERRDEIVFVPFGGGEMQSWAYRLAPLGKAEIHLYDHEIPPLSEQRFATASSIYALDAAPS